MTTLLLRVTDFVRAGSLFTHLSQPPAGWDRLETLPGRKIFYGLVALYSAFCITNSSNFLVQIVAPLFVSWVIGPAPLGIVATVTWEDTLAWWKSLPAVDCQQGR